MKLAMIGLALCGLFLATKACAENASSRPNILFIMADDHAAQAMSCYGSKLNSTPNLDRIAKEGMRFDHCFCTNSICSPSRAVILTGKYSHVNGVSVFNRFDGAQVTFPKLLQQAGYQTAVVGKWHLFSDPTGFDYWNVLPGQGAYRDPQMIENGVTKKYKGYVSDVITDQCLTWLAKRDPQKPFCMLYQHKAPHRNWQPDEKYAKLFDDRELPAPETLLDDYKNRSPAATEATMRIGRDLTKNDLKGESPPADLQGEALVKWKYERYIKDYLRCVQSIDDNVGRVLKWLDDNDLAKNTIVVYTSDQGFFLGEHGWFDKRFMYEESLRMPLVVRYPPKVKAGSTSPAMVLNLDFAQTLLELAGVAAPAEMQGRSFAGILSGEPTPSDWRTSMYYRYYHYPQDHRVQPHLGVRTTRYKLIHFDKIDAWELFDLQNDPHEMKSVYEDPAYADRVAELKKELHRLKAVYKDDDSHTPPTDDGAKPAAKR